MALVGAGMLCTLMDIDPIDEAEFNRWYDKEHMEERASILGFLNCRRYVALEGRPKYLNLYDTECLEALNAPIYQKALQNQTDWSKRMLARFKNFHRTVGRIDLSVGVGHGAVVGFVWIHPVRGREDDLREWFQTRGLAGLADIDDVLSAHLLESDPALSGPPPGVAPSTDGPPADDWHVIVKGTSQAAVTAACRERFLPVVFEDLGSATHASFGVYALIGAFGIQGGMG